MKNNEAPSRGAPLPVVGIGASAGGLVALEQFLSHVPADSGIAFVIVQHLDPDREGMLVELLRRYSPIPVVQAQDQAQLEPNHVYVIPRGRDLGLNHGVLHLLEPSEPRGLRLPIDFFFKSLADDRQQHSMGVILSGMGSDGTLGLRVIRAAAGASFVQTPADAQFDSMPRSAIDAGLADFIAPAGELPGKIMAYVGRTELGAQVDTEAEVDPKDGRSLDNAITLLRNQTGHDFSLYKKSTLTRRVERRMSLHQLRRMDDYVRYMRESPQESDLLLNEVLIGVTSFFRDPPAWEQVKTEVIPALVARQPQGAVLRAWTPGCASGEEAYTLAMIFKEALEHIKPVERFGLQIFASDIDKDAIASARAGIYPRSIAADVSPERLSRFFIDEGAGYRVCNEIREMVIFADHNVIADPPFTKIDFLSCRNLLIYLESELQVKLIQLFHYSLTRGGFLLLGSAESIGATVAGLFAPLPGKTRIFQCLESATRVLPAGFPAAFVQSPGGVREEVAPLAPVGVTPDLKVWVDRLILAQHAPAAVLVSNRGELLYVSGKTGKYLEPAAGTATLNVFAMARPGIREILPEAFHRALLAKTPETIKNVKLTCDGEARWVNIIVQPLQEPAELRGTVLLVFIDPPAPRRREARTAAQEGVGAAARLESLAHELQHSREEARSEREEMQTSQEELRSTNEELQSANEELTTSKEEMQSMNEELQTVNNEMRATVSELNSMSDDMKNLLDSTEIATLFLDEALHVRRFTATATQLFKLIPDDMGRPITDITTDLKYPDMVQDAKEVLRTLVFHEKDVPTIDQRWFKVRIVPYRTQENRTNGVVITFSDRTAYKKLQADLDSARTRLEALKKNEQPEDVGHGIS